MSSAVRPLVRFPPFVLDPQRHVLTCDGKNMPLSPHLVDILGHLASKSGELVTKDALLERFWPDVYVTENTLTRAIADIRKALADDPAAPRFIQTVARRGYRFIGAVESSESEDPFREWVRGRLSLESLDATKLPAAITAFEHAVAATPDYAPAHAGLANACLLQFEQTRAVNAPDRAPLNRAMVHARRACALDQMLGEAWGTLGFVLTAAGEIEEARAAVRRAAALEPTNWRHHFRLGIASWGEERLRAVDRTLSLLPDFAPARFLAAMVFIARQAFEPARNEAAAGAAAQARQSAIDGLPFPAIGLHWLHGLLLLRSGQITQSILTFVREIEEAHDAQIYGAEFRVNAQVAAGFAHLAANDPAGAIEAFRSALAILPRNGRALVGLYQAILHTGFADEAPLLLREVERSVSELTSGGRAAEAALVGAASLAAQGQIDAACVTLQRLVDHAPPGQIGWLIPIDPALAPLRSAPGFERITARLAARAA